MIKPFEKLLLLGAGGHCRSVLACLDQARYAQIGIVDQAPNDGREIMGVPIVGGDDDLPRLQTEGFTSAFITLGSVGDPGNRMRLYRLAKALGFAFPTIIDATAIVAGGVQLGEGTWIGKGAIVNTGASLGACCIVNSGAVIDHDCCIGDFCHIAPGVTLSGNITVGSESHIGAGSTVIQNLSIGEKTVIGAGSVVTNNISASCVAFGNPCKVQQKKVTGRE